LRILIAGAGIGGLTAALALLRNGIDVELYEQAAELKEVGAGVQLAANGTRVLHALGVGEELKALSAETQSKEIRLWNTGETWKLFDLGPVSIERYGAPYFTVYRPDLLDVLARAVRREKSDAIHLASRCTEFAQDDDGVTLGLESGDTARGDALLGADGVHSRTRQTLFGRTSPSSPASSPGAASYRWSGCPSTWRAWWARTGSGPAATSCITRCAPGR